VVLAVGSSVRILNTPSTVSILYLSRRVVRVEIGQKPGVVRGTGSSNPSPSRGESDANLAQTV
jgi:hypothetical protein